MTRRRMTVRHRRTGTTSVQYIHYHINLISFLKILFLTISHTKSTTSPNRFRNHNVAGALPRTFPFWEHPIAWSTCNPPPPKNNLIYRTVQRSCFRNITVKFQSLLGPGSERLRTTVKYSQYINHN